MKIYLRVLAIAYLIGFALHGADILDMRLQFSNMDILWKIWIIFLCLMDLIAAIGLWRQKTWGIVCFFVVAISQLIAYLIFIDKFGRQDFLVGFHLVTLIGYSVINLSNKNKSKIYLF